MTEFEKLEAVDFDFFHMSTEERKAILPLMRRRMQAFAKSLGTRPAVRKVAKLYGQKSVEDWKYGEPSAVGRGLWFNIGGDPSHRTWHATLFYRPQGMAATVLNSSNHLAGRLYRAGVDVFREIIDIAAQTPGVYVGCRRAWYSNPDSPYKGRSIERTEEPILVETRCLDSAARDLFALVLRDTIGRFIKKKKEWRTELHIRQDISRQDLLKLSAGKQVHLVSEAFGNMQPILKRLLKL